MITRRSFLGLGLPALALASGPISLRNRLVAQSQQQAFRINIWNHPGSKGCCAPWVEKLVEAGFPVEFEHTPDPAKLRKALGIPEDLWCCHTALIEGYIIEGHATVEDIQRLLDDRPIILGLAAPSFFDEKGNVRTEGTYDVVAFSRPDVRSIFATHPLPG